MLTGVLLGALVAADVHTSCVAVAEAGIADPQVVAQQCAAQRPAQGFWLPRLSEDCEQFSTMFRLAQRLNSGLTAETFCADVQDPDAGLLKAHAQCMRLWSSAVDAPTVQAALQHACEEGHGPACVQFASALHELPGEVRRSLCDRSVTNGTGSWALDRQHIQYSCREFALNCASNRTCVPEAGSRCAHAGFTDAFCSPFTALVKSVHTGQAESSAADSFCQAHAKDAGTLAATETPTAVPVATPVAAVAVAEPATAAAAAPATTAASSAGTAGGVGEASADTEAAVSDCVEHTKQMLALGLGADELQHVALEVCAKKYASSICGNFTALVAKASTSDETARGPALHDACRVAISQNPFDMYSVCKQAVDKVEGTELEGDAFQKASFEVCTRLLEHEMQSVDAPIADGCTYFSGQLVAARARGPVKADAFCTQLTSNQEGTEDAAKPEEPASVKASSLVETKPKVMPSKGVSMLSAPAPHPVAVAPAVPAPVLAQVAPAPKLKVAKASLMEGSSRKVLLRKHIDTPPLEVKASAEDEAFLNKFLDSYEAKAGSPQSLQQRVDKAFPETQQVPAVKSSGNVDDVISDFLSNYDH